MSIDGFDESYYLNRYPYIVDAVKKGKYRSGKDHYTQVGHTEGRVVARSLEDAPKLPLEDSPELDVEVGKHVIISSLGLLKRRLQGQHTYVVVGSSRGGTSSIAFAMYHQGIDMGVEDTVNYEDPYFVKSMRRGFFDNEAVRKRIKQQNAKTDVWGMKVPDAAFHLRKLEPLVRNPIFICIYRNPVSIARSVLSRTKVFSSDPEGVSRALSHGGPFYSSVSQSIIHLRSPLMCIEYEHILNNTEPTLREIFGHLGQDLKSPDLLVEHMSRPGYKNIKLNKET